MGNAIELRGVSCVIPSKPNAVVALDDVTIGVRSGEMVALMGPSGSGKSTALRIAGLLRKPSSGALIIDGEAAPPGERARARLRNNYFGFVHQEFAIINDVSVLANVTIPLEYAHPRVARKQRRLRARAELERFGIDSSMHSRRATALSGGQRQRVAIARAMVNQPNVIVADEPTAALDSALITQVMDIFSEVREQGTTVMIATHDDRVAQRCDRVVRLLDGVLDEG